MAIKSTTPLHSPLACIIHENAGDCIVERGNGVFATDCVLKRWSGRPNECGRAIFACASNEWAIADVLIPKRVSEAGGNGERAELITESITRTASHNGSTPSPQRASPPRPIVIPDYCGWTPASFIARAHLATSARK